MCMDTNHTNCLSGFVKSTQQKRHLLQDAFLNGGAVIFDGAWVLRTPSGDVQFPV